MTKDGLNKETFKLVETILSSNILKATFEKLNYMIGLSMQYRFDTELEKNLIAILSTGISSFNILLVSTAMLISTILAIQTVKNLIHGILIVNNATRLALLVQDLTLFSVFLVTTLTIIFMIEEQFALKHAEMASYLAIMTVMTETSILMMDALMIANMNQGLFACQARRILQQFVQKSAAMGGK